MIDLHQRSDFTGDHHDDLFNWHAYIYLIEGCVFAVAAQFRMCFNLINL